MRIQGAGPEQQAALQQVMVALALGTVEGRAGAQVGREPVGLLAQAQTCATSVFKAGSKVFEGHEGNRQDVLKKG